MSTTKIKLTKKQEAFCLNYFETGHATNSAIVAGYSKGCARQTGAENTTKPVIIERLAELQAILEAKIGNKADKTVADKEERQEILSEIARGRVVDFTKDNRIKVTPESLNTAAIQGLETSEVQIGRGDGALTVEITKLKLHNPIQAIAELNKMDHIYEPERIVLTDIKILVVREQPRLLEPTETTETGAGG